MRRRLLSAGLALALLTGLAGCGAAAVDRRTDDSNVIAKYVTLPDGREVVCVFWVSSSSTTNGGGSIECDFGGAR